MRETIVAGHICLDLMPALTDLPTLEPGKLLEIGRMQVRPGGCVANTGAALAKAGIPVRLEADIGGDEIGGILSNLMRRLGADISGLQPTSLSTSYSIVIETDGHDRTFWHHVGANAAFDGHGIQLRDAALLHVGYPSILPGLLERDGDALIRLLDRARAQGVTTSLDLAVIGKPTPESAAWWRSLVTRIGPLIDIASPSREDIESATGLSFGTGASSLLKAARYLVQQGVGIAMVSGGADGVALVAARMERLQRGGSVLGALQGWAVAELFEPAVPVARPRTTTGAGDAATAGLLAALQRGVSPSEALKEVVSSAAAHISGGGMFALTAERA